MTIDYKIRCDKHAFSKIDYCEMCMLRTQVQACVEKAREDSRRMVANTHLAISVLNDIVDVHRNEINILKEKINGRERESSISESK